MFIHIYIILSLFSGSFVLPLLILLQLKYHKTLIAKYILLFSNYYVMLFTYGLLKIYGVEGFGRISFPVFIIYITAYLAANITMPLFTNSLYKVPIKSIYTNVSIGITFLALLAIIDLTKYSKIIDIRLMLTFLYCICSAIIYYKKLNNYISKKIGFTFIIFMILLLLAFIFDTFGFNFIPSFLFFLIINILSITYLIHFLKFSNINLDVNVDINKSLDLTPRELEVFHLIKKGLSYKEICEELFISLPTVKTHLNKIYKKTNTKSRFELAARY